MTTSETRLESPPAAVGRRAAHDVPHDRRVAEISGRGIEPADRETYSNGVSKVTYRDPDGNEVGFGGGPE